MGKADLHIHTSVSDGMASVPQILEHLMRNPKLDVIGVTDHDTVSGGLMARDMARRMGCPFEVVVGSEITTREGHLIGVFLEEEVPSFRPLEETVRAIHTQGGLCIVPHPMSWLTFSVGQRSLERILASEEQEIYFDGIEAFNASVAGLISHGKVRMLNRTRYRLAEVGSSDTHFLAALGSGYTVFDGNSAEDLRSSLLCGTTEAAGKPVALREYGFGQILMQQVRSMIISPGRTLRRPILRVIRRLL